MARFYGSVQGGRGEATRTGHRDLTATAASWSGAVVAAVFDRDGADWCEVRLRPWHGKGVDKLIYRGPVGDYLPDEQAIFKGADKAQFRATLEKLVRDLDDAGEGLRPDGSEGYALAEARTLLEATAD